MTTETKVMLAGGFIETEPRGEYALANNGVTTFTDLPFNVTITVSIATGRAECVALTIARKQGGPAVRGTELRALKVGDLTTRAAVELLRRVTPTGLERIR